MSKLAVGRGLEDLELWLAGLFSAAELAAAQLLLQLSVAKGIDDDEASSWSSSATTSPSPRSVIPGSDTENLTAEAKEEELIFENPATEEKEELAEERVVEKPAVSTELDRRARKRYRRLSELYAATSPVTSTPSAASAEKKKRKRSHHCHHGFGTSSSSSSVEATRYGGGY